MEDWMIVGLLNFYLGNTRVFILLLLVLQEKLHWIFQLYGFKRNRGVIVCGQQYMLWVLIWMSCLISYQQLTGSNQILLL